MLDFPPIMSKFLPGFPVEFAIFYVVRATLPPAEAYSVSAAADGNPSQWTHWGPLAKACP